MLGVEKGKVSLSEYSPEWKELYQEERDKLLTIEAIKEINQVGSTSIEGILAKPIIDMAFIYKEDMEKIIKSLEDLAYEYKGDGGVEGRIFFVKTIDGKSSYHLSGYREDDENYNNLLVFRDYLNENEKYRNEYEKLKKNLYEKYAGDRIKYTLGKTIFIKLIIKKAEQENKREKN